MSKHRRIVKKKNKKSKKDINHMKKKINVLSVDNFENRKYFIFKFLNLFLFKLNFFNIFK